MDFDRFSIALLVRQPDAPSLDEEAATELQEAHMAHLADLHEAGHLLAAGPLAFGDPRSDFRGLSILDVDPEQARELKEGDPAVKAGLYRVEVLPWLVPKGAMSFAPTRFPRTIAEAMS
jgi:uncharacterized protein YciI